MKKIVSVLLIVCMMMSLSACSENNDKSESVAAEKSSEPQETILLAAAASLNNCIDKELIPLYEEKNPDVKVEATYDSSGKLQAQIEEGAGVDVFMSASTKQMNALDEEGLIKEGSIVELLENKIVLIVPEESDKGISSFEEILNADTIAVGDPESVPAGQYAKEAFENLSMWEDVYSKASLGTNVTEVLNWIAEGSADAGVVYATDAASNDKVQVVAQAPEGSVSKIIYPVGIINSTENEDAAMSFIEFLKTEEALEVFQKYGFSANE
jgi:molybdate transport system substrate-binding protein